MSGEKTTSQQSQTAQMTPEERALLEQQRANNAFMMPYAQKNYAALSDNINAILMGGQPMAKGIGGVDAAQTQDMVNSSLRDIYPQFQTGGIIDSGLAAQIASNTSAGVRNQNAQFNVSAAQNLFNLASGGQSNLQGQFQNSTNNMTNQLSGLRTTNTSGSTIGMNPFLKSFQQSLGTGLGNSATAGVNSAFGAFCWVAAELFDGWSDIRTIQARFYIMFHAPKWFRNIYSNFGKEIAKYISDKPLLKNILRPLFMFFSSKGKEKLNGRY